MVTTVVPVAEQCRAARAAARRLALLETDVKNAALEAIAQALELRTGEILDANARDLEAGREAGLSEALLDRLTLTPERVGDMASGVRAIKALGVPGF